MDVTQQVDSIVENLVRGIETRLEAKLEQSVTKVLQQKLESIDVDHKLNWLASVKLDSMISQMEIDRSTVQGRVDAVTDTVVNGIESELRRQAQERVRTYLHNQVDMPKLVRELISSEIGNRIDTMAFPDGSIAGSAIDPSTLQLTGNNITGGIIQNFSSTGIEDKSNDVQMTLLNEAVVIENRMITLGLEVQGTTVLNGDIVLNGTVPVESTFYTSIVNGAVEGVKNSMDQEFFGDYSTVIFNKIKAEGLDLNRITLNGVEVITGNKLNYGITDTNITRVGLVSDLQTTGETYLSQQLYVGKNKVGIGTIEPGHALSVWDQEVEIGFGKRQKDTGWIGTPRKQNLILSAGNEDNLCLNEDGSVSVKKITVGKVSIVSSDGTPNSAQPRGTVAFNENPAPGQPIGWVSLGNGSWAKFGTVG